MKPQLQHFFDMILDYRIISICLKLLLIFFNNAYCLFFVQLDILRFFAFLLVCIQFSHLLFKSITLSRTLNFGKIVYEIGVHSRNKGK